MLLHTLGEYDEVVLVHHTELGEEWAKHVLHHALEGGWCIAKSHRHDEELKSSKRRADGGLVDVLGRHQGLPKALKEVEAGHHLAAGQLVEEVTIAGQRVPVLDGYGVEVAVVEHEAERAVRLWCKQNRRSIR